MNERRDWAPVDWSPMKRLIYLRGNPATGGGGGSPLTVSGPTPLLMPGALAKPMRKATFSIEAVQSGSGDPSPSNVRPITGWTGANCYVTGANLFDEEWESGAISNSDGQNIASSSSIRAKNFIAFKPGISKITISWDAAETGSVYALAMLYKSDKTFSRYYGAFTKSGYVFAVNADEEYLRFYLYNKTTPIVNCMVNHGITASPYTPYSGSTVSVEFPASVGTVYGGTIDPVTGEGVVTHKEVDLGSLSWMYRNGLFDATVTGGKLSTYSGGGAEAICSQYAQKAKAYSLLSYGEMAFGNGYVNGSTCSVIIKDSDYSDTASFKTAMNGVKLVYELATPIPFTLTPQTLTPPAGDAYIWADCGGSAEVTYIGKA